MVHVGFSRRLGRRIVQSAALLDGLDSQGEPILLPLLEARHDEDERVPGGGRVGWGCQARFVGQQLVWHDPQHTTPTALAALLADVPTEGEQSIVHTVAAEQQVADLLVRAREQLPYPDQAAQVIQLLELAYQLDPQQREIWSLVDRLLASNAAVRDSTGAAVEVTVEQMHAALQARDLAAVRAAANAEHATLLVQAALNQDARWQELHAAGVAFIDQVEDLEAALAAAYAIARQLKA